MQEISPLSPEARRRRLAKLKAQFGEHVVERLKPGTRPFEVVKRVVIGVYSDGFIHAGNLAYLSLLVMFPFFILAAAVAQLLGRSADAQRTVFTVLQQLPPNVAAVLRDPIAEVLTARQGALLWFGAIVGLWTATSFIETIRDILRRAYGVKYSAPFYTYRLLSILFMLGLVLLLMTSFAISVAMSSIEALLIHLVPRFADVANSMMLYHIVPGIMLYATIYLVFVVLTPSRYRRIGCRKWPGALLVAVWWIATTTALPWVIGLAGGYSLTYGSLAGVMIALLFFFVIGLGVVTGAELNAALADSGAKALKGEIYSGPFQDQLEVEQPEPDEKVPKIKGEVAA